MEYRMSEWEEEKEFTTDQLTLMVLNKYNNILNWVRWSNKYPKNAHIINLVEVDHKLPNDSKKPTENPRRESTKGDPAYIRYLPPSIIEETKQGARHKFNYNKEYWWCKEHRKGQGQWVGHIPEGHGNRTKTSTSNLSKK